MRLRQHRRSAQPLPVELAGPPWRQLTASSSPQSVACGGRDRRAPSLGPARTVGELAMMLEQRIPRVVTAMPRRATYR